MKILLIVDRDGTVIENKHFLGKEENWKEQVEFKLPVIELLKFIQNKYENNTVIVTNQSGVARGYFSCEKVEQINKYINEKLKEKEVRIDSWKYCPEIDENYVKSKSDIKFDERYVKKQTKRKPSTDLVYEALLEKNIEIDCIDKIIVLGDSEDDEGLAKNLNANFIQVTGKDYIELKNQFLEYLRIR